MARHHQRRRLAWLLGALPVSLVGLTLVWGHKLSEASFDLPFLFRSALSVPEVEIVYLDEPSRNSLQQTNALWNRQLYAQLLTMLSRNDARLVFFDMTFDQPGDPLVDEELAKAIRDQGRVVLGGRFDQMPHESSIASATDTRLHPPIDLLRTNAAGWGLIMLRPDDSQFTARQLYPGTADYSAAVWVAAELAGAPITRDSSRRLEPRWLSYYGPPYTLPSVSLAEALALPATETNRFRDKFVFVGGHGSAFKSDLFATPYTDFGGGFSPGVEILATAFLNLARGDWLERMPGQAALVGLWGMLATFGLLRLRPWHAAWVALLAAGAIAAASCYVQWQHRLWWTWLVPAAVQTPMALVWSIGYQYAFEYRQRRKLRKAFSSYLSPHLVERIAESDADLSLGGKEVEATILFTDLEGFTALSETLSPAEVSGILTTYFNRTTKHILEQHGTIIKYIGDAVMAVWGAPLPDADHAEHAVLAACGMIQAGRQEIAGRRLRTRIGINTGPALAGNLGSDFRFDYTVIGATTNLASRLEELNRSLGTDILISEATRQKLTDKLAVRGLGRFFIKGVKQPVRVYEVLGPLSSLAQEPPWLRDFESALERFRQGELDEAERLMRSVLESRGGADPPAQFYLRQIRRLKSRPRDGSPWEGIIDLADRSASQT